MRPWRRASFLALAIALVVTAPWIGWWTLLPLLVAAGGFALADRQLPVSPQPERTIAMAWLFAELVIAASVALSGGPESAALPWLAIPLVTLPARFNGRVVAVGLAIAAGLAILVSVGVEPRYVAANPEVLVMPLALMAAVTLLSGALMRSDLEHRSSAAIDPLTGMLNRNALKHRVVELSQQAAITGEPVALVIGDLDRFKAVNDTHGHAVGDAVLRDVAQRMRRVLRAYDLAYRLGGEEFLVVLPGADAEQAAAVAEDVRRAVRELPAGGQAVTISFGLSASPPGTFDYDRVFAEADLALYRAKQEGRDRVCAHEGPADGPSRLRRAA